MEQSAFTPRRTAGWRRTMSALSMPAVLATPTLSALLDGGAAANRTTWSGASGPGNGGLGVTQA
ncbi:MAG: hypothetical protein GY929_16410 [Actinomycetia bacterium]|nr:hypothetical protein [Actinomycetes bacterium]